MGNGQEAVKRLEHGQSLSGRRFGPLQHFFDGGIFAAERLQIAAPRGPYG